eukprot:12634131-Ditylum_brightwellii.AAC.1
MCPCIVYQMLPHHDTYLEELIVPPDESDMNTQTDEEWEQVAPILDVLVETSIEMVVMELEQEEGIALLRRHQDLFEMKQNVELAE